MKLVRLPALGLVLTAALLAPPRPVVAAESVVDVLDGAYNPFVLAISAGDTVIWVNRGTVTHTITADDGAFDSGNVEPGQQASFLFSGPGSYNYHCAFHAEMRGSVIVLAASTPPADQPPPAEPAPPDAAAPQALLTVSPDTVSPGAYVYVFGSGFQPFESIQVQVSAGDLPLFATAVTADASGTYVATQQVPAFVPPGVYTLVALGESSGAVASATLTVR